MKKLLLIALLIVGCDSPTEALPADCAGVAGGTAVEDCAGVCGGDAYLCDGVCGVELWGVCYSIANTTELGLHGSQLTGEIPSEIGQLTNLTYLQLECRALVIVLLL